MSVLLIEEKPAKYKIGKRYVLSKEHGIPVAEVKTCIGYQTDQEVEKLAILFSHSEELWAYLKAYVAAVDLGINIDTTSAKELLKKLD